MDEENQNQNTFYSNTINNLVTDINSFNKKLTDLKIKYNNYEHESEQAGVYYDDITGAVLNTEKVLAARQEELQWIKKQETYAKLPLTNVTIRREKDRLQ